MAPKPSDNLNNAERSNASRPGAQYVTSDEAVRFDGRIAEKRNKNNKTSRDNSYSSLNSSGRAPRQVPDADDLEMNLKPPARPSREESDMMAKNRARAGRPKFIIDNEVDVDDLMENNDMQAKRRAKASRAETVIPGAVSSNDRNAARVDRDIEAKNQAWRLSRMMPSSSVAKKPPAKLTPVTVETSANNDMVAKNQARSRNGPAMIPGVFEERNKNTNDADTVTKNQARSRDGPAMIPGVFEERNNRESLEKKDVAFGRNDSDDRKMDADVLAKKNAVDGGANAAPRFISLEDDDDCNSMTAKKMAAGAEASYSGNQDKKMVGSLGQVYSDEEPYKESSIRRPREQALLGGDKAGQMDVGFMHHLGFEDLDNELAIAKPVIEEELEDAFIPAAVEYDPDSKPPMYKRRRFRIYGFLTLVVVLGGIAAIVAVLHLNQDRDDEGLGPTMAPTVYRESLGIQEQIAGVVGNAIYQNGTAHEKALDWLLHDDPLQLPPDAKNLVQRYLLALFHLLTTEEGPWRSCNPPAGNETADCEYQNVVGVSPLVFEPVPSIRWLSEKPECEWAGVFCSEQDRIARLSLNGQQLSGSIPEELAYLPFLRQISLYYNEFYGTLPQKIVSEMKWLTSFEVNSNFLSGTVPPELFAFENLGLINLGDNQLTGQLTIPADAKADFLQALYIYECGLTGPIPSEIGLLSKLNYVRLMKSSLSGTVPTEIALLTDLTEFWVSKTALTGSIPSEMGTLKLMMDLRLGNTGIGGQVPEELYELTSLDRLDLLNANFTGTLSTKIGLLSSLDFLKISGNNFEGAIPTELNLLTELRQLWLQYNRFEGSVPGGLCQLKNESILFDLAADCAVSNTTGNATVDCVDGCCTQCCDPATLVCDILDPSLG